jgi:hypothetical protein
MEVFSFAQKLIVVSHSPTKISSRKELIYVLVLKPKLILTKEFEFSSLAL